MSEALALIQTNPLLQGVLFGVFVSALTVVQSIFGVGLLVFGTPALLLIGLDYDRVLSMLLPASLTVSVLQITCDGRPAGVHVRGYFIYMLPALGFGMIAALFARASGIDLVVCCLLVFTAILRISGRHREAMLALATRFSRTMLVAIGVVHGMTNMGGSLLEIYVSSREVEKLKTRQGIACGYALLACSQLVVLLAVGKFHTSWMLAISMSTAGVVFLTAGRRSFALIRQGRYRSMVGALMVLAATALITKRLLT